METPHPISLYIYRFTATSAPCFSVYRPFTGSQCDRILTEDDRLLKKCCMMRSVSVVRVPSVATEGEWKIMVQKSSVYQTQASVIVTFVLITHSTGTRP